MKRRFLILIFVLILLVIFLAKNSEIVKDLEKSFQRSKEKLVNESEGGELNESLAKNILENQSSLTNKSINISSNESINVSTKTVLSEENYTKPLTLKIVDICSGKLKDVLIVSEGITMCLNKPYPYSILLEKNSTHLNAIILDKNGFNETFELNESVLIYFLFAEDVSTISKKIDYFYLKGSDYFYLGDYDLHTIWEQDPFGNLYISKMIAALPLYVKKEVMPGIYNLSFYLHALNQSFYLGELRMEIKEK